MNISERYSQQRIVQDLLSFENPRTGRTGAFVTDNSTLELVRVLVSHYLQHAWPDSFEDRFREKWGSQVQQDALQWKATALFLKMFLSLPFSEVTKAYAVHVQEGPLIKKGSASSKAPLQERWNARSYHQKLFGSEAFLRRVRMPEQEPMLYAMNPLCITVNNSIYKAFVCSGDREQLGVVAYRELVPGTFWGVEMFVHQRLASRYPEVVPIKRLHAGGYYSACVMPFYSCTLGQYLERENTLQFRERVQLMIRVARFLSKMHQEQLVYRDLKLANILVDAKNPMEPLFTDFGHTVDLSVTAVVGSRGATPLYASPEEYSVLEGKQHRTVSFQDDVFQLGWVLYGIASGKQETPFSENPALREVLLLLRRCVLLFSRDEEDFWCEIKEIFSERFVQTPLLPTFVDPTAWDAFLEEIALQRDFTKSPQQKWNWLVAQYTAWYYRTLDAQLSEYLQNFPAQLHGVPEQSVALVTNLFSNMLRGSLAPLDQRWTIIQVLDTLEAIRLELSGDAQVL